jgi:hypothetical protein
MKINSFKINIKHASSSPPYPYLKVGDDYYYPSSYDDGDWVYRLDNKTPVIFLDTYFIEANKNDSRD